MPDRSEHRSEAALDGAPAGQSAAWGMARAVIGIALIAVGLVGCVLPIIPGVPMVLAGVALLGTRHPLVRPFAERLERWRRQRRS